MPPYSGNGVQIRIGFIFLMNLKGAKKVEFRNKSLLVVNKYNKIIPGTPAVKGNPVHCFDLFLDQEQPLMGKRSGVAIVDTGFRERKVIGEIRACSLENVKASADSCQKQKIRNRFRARAEIEPVAAAERKWSQDGEKLPF